MMIYDAVVIKHISRQKVWASLDGTTNKAWYPTVEQNSIKTASSSVQPNYGTDSRPEAHSWRDHLWQAKMVDGAVTRPQLMTRTDYGETVLTHRYHLLLRSWRSIYKYK